jgi:hypothetical protein
MKNPFPVQPPERRDGVDGLELPPGYRFEPIHKVCPNCELDLTKQQPNSRNDESQPEQVKQDADRAGIAGKTKYFSPRNDPCLEWMVAPLADAGRAIRSTEDSCITTQPAAITASTTRCLLKTLTEIIIMNAMSQPARWPLNIYQDAYLSAVRRANLIVAALEAAKNEVAQFQALCDLLLDRGLKFEAETYSSDSGYLIYTIRMIHGNQHDYAGDMLCALSTLGCDEKSMAVCDITHRVNYTITSKHVPEFNLSIRREVRHAEKLAA